MTKEKSSVRPGGLTRHFQDERDLKAAGISTSETISVKMDQPAGSSQDDQKIQD